MNGDHAIGILIGFIGAVGFAAILEGLLNWIGRNK